MRSSRASSLKLSGQVDGDVGAQLPGAHLFRQKATFETLVVVAAAGGDDLRAEHLERLRIELALAVHHGAQHWQAAHVAVVEDFNDLRPLVAEAKIGLVEDERAAERVEGVEDRRHRRSAAREEALVAERADRQKRPGLPASVIPSQTEVRQLIEGVIQPGQKDVVRRNVLERLAKSTYRRMKSRISATSCASLPYIRGSLGSSTTSFLIRLLFAENGTSFASGPRSIASCSVHRPAL